MGLPDVQSPAQRELDSNGLDDLQSSLVYLADIFRAENSQA
jgi:hypothetical protein